MNLPTTKHMTMQQYGHVDAISCTAMGARSTSRSTMKHARVMEQRHGENIARPAREETAIAKKGTQWAQAH